MGSSWLAMVLADDQSSPATKGAGAGAAVVILLLVLWLWKGDDD